MKYIVSKPGIVAPIVYASEQPDGFVRWVTSPKKATEFNLTAARKFVRKFAPERLVRVEPA